MVLSVAMEDMIIMGTGDSPLILILVFYWFMLGLFGLAL